MLPYISLFMLSYVLNFQICSRLASLNRHYLSECATGSSVTDESFVNKTSPAVQNNFNPGIYDDDTLKQNKLTVTNVLYFIQC